MKVFQLNFCCSCKSAKSGEDRTNDGEMDVRGVAERQEAHCGSVVGLRAWLRW